MPQFLKVLRLDTHAHGESVAALWYDRDSFTTNEKSLFQCCISVLSWVYWEKDFYLIVILFQPKKVSIISNVNIGPEYLQY